ncbi:MAG: HAMP domain-containing histidine kinase [Proteobacteria bacterium]|nr:HAMP domain-containing histidine kinase [Pseudomonadota bacterium]
MAFPIVRVTASSIRRISYWALGVALVLLIAMGVWQAWRLQRDLETRELDRASKDLERQASLWDDALAQRSAAWLQDVEDSDTLRARQAWYRDGVSYFDSFYKWELKPGQLGATILFPTPVPWEDLPSLNEDRCLRRARARESFSAPADVPDLYAACIDGASADVALFAATEAATRFLAQGRADEAVAALDATGIPADLGLDAAAAAGLAPRRVALRRLLHAEALQMAERNKFAVGLLVELGEDIVSADGPVLQQVLDFVDYPVQEQLRQLGAPDQAVALEAPAEAAAHRLAAWKEVETELSVRAERGADCRVVHDQYGGGFLLVYSEISPGIFGAAQIDESILIAELLESSEESASLLVTDRAGRMVAGAGEPEVSADFPRMLSHLSLAYPPDHLTAVQAEFRAQFLSQLLPILVGGIIGFAALAARVTADRREQELLERQREFATRVTHELKTPLAGIRVMAENLELGAASDPGTIKAFSGRIIAEADKLTARIEEILQVARSRTPARPVPYDPAALTSDILREWAPRFADAGVRLTQDVQPVGMAVGDVPLLRDAFVCLLDNALKYRREDEPRPLVDVRLHREGNQCVLEVTDNGIGVPPAKRRAIFQVFARVEGPGRGKAGGHGLGLAFVADAVTRHRGRVDCEDGLDGGARFVVRLPLSG